MFQGSGKTYGNPNLSAKISAQRLDELISLYLDKEASNEELELLAKVIKHDKEAFQIFEKSCKLHLATCKIFGKVAMLSPLPGLYMPRHKRISTRRAILEWSMVGMLMIICGLLFKISKQDISVNYVAYEQNNAPSHNKDELVISDSFVATGNTCTLMITPKN